MIKPLGYAAQHSDGRRCGNSWGNRVDPFVPGHEGSEWTGKPGATPEHEAAAS